ncbi:MAG TPA: ABC transporter ATP-binding protein [Longimicrobiales bacterium]|nr:ABC transporter ATP-binding protein [Longimicrobiales bacterium]
MTAVQVRGLGKRYGPVVALRNARLTAHAGEVHGVLGENGAGKTTLLSVLAGLVAPDVGEVRIHGEPAHIPSPRAARRLGIGMVHQHFALVPRLTVLENLMLGWPGGLLSLPSGEVTERALRMEADTGLHVPLDAPVEALGVGERQRVEILKVLLQDPRILVLDEPTAVLTPPEVQGLLGLVRTLAEQGTAVLMVAHKLDEVLAVAHRVTVLRHGETVLEAPRDQVDAPALARAMVGTEAAGMVMHLQEAAARREARPPARGEPVARLVGVRMTHPGGGERLRDVSLEVRPGEIVGIAGVEGNGQRELARVLAGELDPDAGTLTLPAEPAFIPQDRRTEGLVEDFDLTENVALRLHRAPEARWGPFLDWRVLRHRTARALATFSVRAEGPGVRAGTLSGGNQQRVVLARELEGDPAFVVAENPTRGLDVAGESFVHEALRRLRDRPENPAGVVLLSTDLDEVLALADRFFVMVRGRLEPVEPGPGLRERMGARMLGAG